ncbi:MAG: hypothetical protein IJ011_02940 [Clostridia bacterium]|nr:hypothetical protein [Clostridia bacterium]
MSKKLICLFLGLIMLLSVCLTACGEKDDETAVNNIGTKASENAETLAMYLMSEKPVDADTVAEIEEAVNKITENKFKTRLKLYYYTEEEYYAKLEAAFAERDERKANGTLVSSKTEAETGEDETFVNEYGIVEIKYPTVTGYQVDIFYMGGKEMYDKYKADGRLQRLDDEINSSSKDLTTNIPSQYLSNIKSLNKGTYAIPTSKPIGEYTYLLLNKDAMTQAYLRSETGSTTYEGYTSLTCDMVKEFLELVDTDSELSKNYYPLYTNLESIELMLSNLKYWGVDDEGLLSEAFSVLGGYYGANDDYLDANKYAKLENLFENEQFISDITTLMQYKFDGYYTAEEGQQEFAVGYVKGGKEVVEQYGEDYELVVVEYPRLTEEELYSDMFAVCSYTSNTGRAMKILTLLNTDANFRNLVLYGIEGVHYQLVDTGVDNEYGEDIMAVERFETGENKYMMDVNKTGNTFIAYPLVGESATLKGYGIVQNQEAKVSLDLGFSLDACGYEVDVESLKAVKALSDEILAGLKACNTEAELEAFIKSAKEKIAASEAVQAHVGCELGADAEHEDDGTSKDSEDRCGSISCCYESWLKDNDIIK